VNTVITFRGGFLDGQEVTGPRAKRYLFLSDGGKIGERFCELPVELEERIEELLMPKERRDQMEEVMMQTMQDPVYLAMFTLASTKPYAISREAIEKTVYEAHQKASLRLGIEELPELSESQVKELAEELSRLSVHHIYEVTERIEKDDELRIRMSFVGDDNTATVERP